MEYLEVDNDTIIWCLYFVCHKYTTCQLSSCTDCEISPVCRCDLPMCRNKCEFWWILMNFDEYSWAHSTHWSSDVRFRLIWGQISPRWETLWLLRCFQYILSTKYVHQQNLDKSRIMPQSMPIWPNVCSNPTTLVQNV